MSTSPEKPRSGEMPGTFSPAKGNSPIKCEFGHHDQHCDHDHCDHDDDDDDDSWFGFQWKTLALVILSAFVCGGFLNSFRNNQDPYAGGIWLVKKAPDFRESIEKLDFRLTKAHKSLFHSNVMASLNEEDAKSMRASKRGIDAILRELDGIKKSVWVKHEDMLFDLKYSGYKQISLLKENSALGDELEMVPDRAFMRTYVPKVLAADETMKVQAALETLWKNDEFADAFTEAVLADFSGLETRFGRKLLKHKIAALINSHQVSINRHIAILKKYADRCIKVGEGNQGSKGWSLGGY